MNLSLVFLRTTLECHPEEAFQLMVRGQNWVVVLWRQGELCYGAMESGAVV